MQTWQYRDVALGKYKERLNGLEGTMVANLRPDLAATFAAPVEALD
jgi:hypothetical protein